MTKIIILIFWKEWDGKKIVRKKERELCATSLVELKGSNVNFMIGHPNWNHTLNMPVQLKNQFSEESR